MSSPEPEQVDNDNSGNHTKQHRMISENIDECIICFNSFNYGDLLSSSSNKSCVYSFHKACIIEWLMKNDTCPVCRCDYLSTSTNEANETKVSVSSGDSDNIEVELEDDYLPPPYFFFFSRY